MNNSVPLWGSERGRPGRRRKLCQMGLCVGGVVFSTACQERNYRTQFIFRVPKYTPDCQFQTFSTSTIFKIEICTFVLQLCFRPRSTAAEADGHVTVVPVRWGGLECSLASYQPEQTEAFCFQHQRLFVFLFVRNVAEFM